MVYRISELHFSLLSPDVVKNLARVRVVTADLYDADGYPVEGGVMDPRLGVIDPGLHCRTCGGGIGDCPGHLGYLELAKPVINVLYTKVVYQLLKMVCRKCQKVMVEEGKERKSKRKHKITISDVEANIDLDSVIVQPATCPFCKTKSKKITFVKPYTYYEEKKELSPMDIRERFEKVSDKELTKVGFNGGRPEWLILTLFPVPPVTMRPSITLEGGERSEDDLTHKLVDIVRINQSLKENIDIGAPEFILNDLWELVQYHISTYFDNELTGAPLARHRSGRALKGLIQRLKAKEGRLRGNLLGKRVNFSARTVISPDPRLSINEVGVPESIAQELTLPFYVTTKNVKEAQRLIRNQKANYVIRPDGRRIKITEENKTEIVQNLIEGWIVERQLENGDVVLYNRQPSLHRMSIMAHRVRVMPYQTFRMNPSVCFPYNADFDGDEMNVHVPQTEEARVEAAMLMAVENNLISPRFGGPVIGLDLDQISGIALLTKAETKLSRRDATLLFGLAGFAMELPAGKEELTGKELFSLLLPEDFAISGYRSNFYKNRKIEKKGEDPDEWIEIKDGKLISGIIDKQSVAAENGKLIQKLERMTNPTTAKMFIDRAGRLGAAYLMLRGFSLSIADLDLPPEAQTKTREEIQKAEEEANQLIVQYQTKELTTLPGMTRKESLEAQIMNALASGVSRASDVVETSMKPNDIRNMYLAGSKGSVITTTQMAAVVGQETILGKRIKRGYQKRTLAHYKEGDLTPGAHGFVAHSFKQGLDPFEMMWNIMNGREGLMDKSLRTRKSGYMQRRLINALQDLKVMHDGTVRNAHGRIIQFTAGEDGIDPSKSDWGTIAWKDRLDMMVKE